MCFLLCFILQLGLMCPISYIEPAWVAAIKEAARARAQARGIAQVQANLEAEREHQMGQKQLKVVNANSESLISNSSSVGADQGSHEESPISYIQHSGMDEPVLSIQEPLESPAPAGSLPDDGIIIHEHLVVQPILPHPNLRNNTAQTMIIRNPEMLDSFKHVDGGATGVDNLSPLSQLDKDHMLTLAIGPPLKPSLETVERSVATKIYLENHYYSILKRPRDRDQRRAALERELAAASMSDSQRRAIRAAWTVSETEHLRDLRNRVHANSFKKLKTIGHGAFGVVSLVRERGSGEVYAMKQLRKADMLRKGQEGHVRAERDVLSAASSGSLSRWIVRLVYSFQDVDHLYLVMEYMGGGDLLNLLIEKDVFEESFAKFYVAEMVLAVQEAHKLGYIHRDIKVTFLLDAGILRIQLTGFFLALPARQFHLLVRWAH